MGGSKDRRRALYPAILLVMSTSLGLCAAWAGILLHLKAAERSGLDGSFAKRLSRYTLAQRLFERQAYHDLIRAVASNESDTFQTTWDFDDGVGLSRKMFITEEMFGAIKYRYRPNTGIYNVRVWSGLTHQMLAMSAAPEIAALLERNTLARKVYFETDANGFKPTARTAGGPPILMLGDSFVEGLWVSPEETFTSVLAGMLKAGGTPGSPINMGVNGYSTLEMAWTLERYAPKMRPVLVLVNLFPNDVHNDYRRVVVGEVPEANYREMLGHLERMMRYCRSRGIIMALAVIPPKEQFSFLRSFSDFQDRVGWWAGKRGVPLFDPREHFDSIGPGRIYFPWDPHFSPEGHRHYAKFLHGKLSPLLRGKASGKRAAGS